MMNCYHFSNNKIIKEIQKLGQQKQLKLDKRSQLEDELNVIQS